MLITILRILRFIWPFLREMWFGEKTILEAARDNKVRTAFILLVIGSVSINAFGYTDWDDKRIRNAVLTHENDRLRAQINTHQDRSLEALRLSWDLEQRDEKIKELQAQVALLKTANVPPSASLIPPPPEEPIVVPKPVPSVVVKPTPKTPPPSRTTIPMPPTKTPERAPPPGNVPPRHDNPSDGRHDRLRNQFERLNQMSSRNEGGP